MVGDAHVAPLETGGHSRLAPSNAHRWVPCPGAIIMCESIPPEQEIGGDQEAAREGTGAHEFAESWLENGAPPPFGSVASNGVVFTNEMCEAVFVYASFVLDLIKNATGNRSMYGIEDLIKCPSIHNECFGTVDAWVYDENTHTLWVIDYKHGHMAVEAYENWQCIIYASGIIDLLFGEYNIDVQQLTLKLAIVQPRSFHRDGPLRVWETNVDGLHNAWWRAHESACNAMGGDPKCTPGPQCAKCRGRHGCEANQRAVSLFADYAFSPVPTNMSPSDAGVEWCFLKRAIRMLNQRLEAVDAQVKHHAQCGVRIPAVSAAPGNGRQNWTKPVDEVVTLGQMYEIDVTKPVAVITPKQAIAAGIPETLINSPEFSERTATGIKLTETATNNDAALIFGAKA